MPDGDSQNSNSTPPVFGSARLRKNKPCGINAQPTGFGRMHRLEGERRRRLNFQF